MVGLDDGWPSGGIAGHLRHFGDHPAAITAAGAVSYAQLAERVSEVGERLGETRRLVLLAGGNDLDTLVAYLAALDGGHPVMLVAADNRTHWSALVERYRPDVTITCTAGGARFEEVRPGSAHDLHPELALLMSTSGSTGAAKLVRLSRRNVASNASAIGEYLGITSADRALTTLPINYCYGLSVINSHLWRGATLVLTELSVVDRCFWDLLDATGATSFAGVPYTFDLLDRVGFEDRALPSLRLVTQAGGRLAPERVQRYAQLGRRRGWDFVVMYGQTEATARMAYLPPAMAAAYPSAIGVAIPGGSLRVDAPAGESVGELVYRGPNVMLGYAERPTDLALGATLDELRTGDLARGVGDGLFEIVGRSSRFVKPFGLRIDLDQVERRLASAGVTAIVAGTDERLVVATAADRHGVATLVAEHTGLPLTIIDVVDEPPRLPNGKPDYPALLATPPVAIPRPAPSCGVGAGADLLERLCAIYTEVLGRSASPSSSFVDLGGDSLSYIEVSTRIEDELGVLPADWHLSSIGELAAQRRARRRIVSAETNVVLRAVAIVLIVGNHIHVWRLLGTAHVLLGVAGLNFARFVRRSNRMAASIARIAIPSMCIIGLAAATRTDFSWPHALLLNAQFGGADTRWGYWYVEALVQVLVPVALALSVPAVRRFERARATETAFIVLAIATAMRFALPDTHHEIGRAPYVLWLFAAGWAAAVAHTSWQRMAITLSVLVAARGFTGEGLRDAVIAAGMTILIWVPRLPVPRLLTPAVGRLASASLYIYLTHWMIYPTLARWSPIGAVIGSLVVGIAVAAVAMPAATAIERMLTRPPRDAIRPDVLPQYRNVDERVSESAA